MNWIITCLVGFIIQYDHTLTRIHEKKNSLYVLHDHYSVFIIFTNGNIDTFLFFYVLTPHIRRVFYNAWRPHDHDYKATKKFHNDIKWYQWSIYYIFFMKFAKKFFIEEIILKKFCSQKNHYSWIETLHIDVIYFLFNRKRN